MVALVLYQPDIPQNTGTILRMTACLGVAAHIIEPTGFDLTDRTLRRAGLDYLHAAEIVRHGSFDAFEAYRGEQGKRLVLLTTKADQAYTEFAFERCDLIMLGRESAGVPDAVHDAADRRVRIPMREDLRSLNIAVAGAMVLGEALRQIKAWP